MTNGICQQYRLIEKNKEDKEWDCNSNKIQSLE